VMEPHQGRRYVREGTGRFFHRLHLPRDYGTLNGTIGIVAGKEYSITHSRYQHGSRHQLNAPSALLPRRQFPGSAAACVGIRACDLRT